MKEVAMTEFWTLAPMSLDKKGTREVESTYAFNVEGVWTLLRKVLVPKSGANAQFVAYENPTPYVTLDADGIAYYIKKGKVTQDLAQVASGQDTTNTGEDTTMARTKKAITTPVVAPIAGMSPLGMTEVKKAPVSTLEAILAAPITPAPAQAALAPKKHLTLPAERSEEKLVQDLAPGFAMHAEMYKAFVQAFRQALAEEGLVIVPMEYTQGLAVAPSKAPEPVKEPDVWDILGDGTGAPRPCQAPAPEKPKSTLKLGKDIPQAQVRPAPNGKSSIDPAVARAIQQAWKNRARVPVTQAQLAQKYGMDDKKVWYVINRLAQLA